MKTPPHSLEAETTLLGTVLQSQDAAAIAMSRIKPEHFYDPRHQAIMSASCELAQRNEAVNIVSVATWITEHKRGEVQIAYISGLTDCIPHLSHVEGYCKIIKDMHQKRGMIMLAQKSQDRCYSQDPVGEVMNEFGTGFFALSADVAKEARKIGDVLPSVVMEIKARQDGTFTGGIMTGFSDLDRRWNGLSRKDLIVIAARPSMGKTALAMNIAEHMCRDGKKVMVFSLEMGRESLAMRMLSGMARVNGDTIKKGYTSDGDWQKLSRAMGRMSGMNLVVDDSSGLSIVELCSRAKVESIKGEIDAIIVDYLQLLHAKAENRTNEIAVISRSLKGLAKDLNCPVIALSQLNRGLEQRADKRPIMSDLRESGAIEQDADVIAFVYRDEVYNNSPDNPLRGVAEIITAKQRNGPIGRDELLFIGEYCRFESKVKYQEAI